MSDDIVKAEAGAAIERKDEPSLPLARIGGFMPQSFNDVARMARALSEARGFVPREMIGNPNAIAAAIMTGMEIGIGPMQALRSIYVIDGRPMIAADLMLALAIRAGVRPHWIHSDAERAHLRLTRDGFEAHEHVFTIAEAKQAGLAGRGNWTKFPAAMLRARCLSAAMRAFCPDVIGSGVYVEGEIEPEPRRPSVRSEDTIEGEIASEKSDAPPARAQSNGNGNGKKPPSLAESIAPVVEADELAAWCRKYAAAVKRKGAEAIAHVVAHGESKCGVSAEQVRTWLGISDADEGEEGAGA
jgi:hypothetical protein